MGYFDAELKHAISELLVFRETVKFLFLNVWVKNLECPESKMLY